MDKRHWEHGPCPKHDCRKDSCKCGLRLISLPAALGDDSKGSPVAPKNGDYCNALVKYESNGHIYVYSTEGVPTLISGSGSEGGHNIVVELENGMTTYPAGTAPISFEDALAAFQNGQSIFLIDHTSRMDDIYTVSAIEAHDGIWSMKVERVGMDLQNDEGFWVVKAHNPTEWRSVDFFKSVIDPATETQVETVVSKIGDLEDLQTTDKDTVVDAINEIVSGGGGGGTSDFNSLTNRPKYNNTTMSSATNIPEVPSAVSQLTNDLDFQTGGEVNSTVASAVAGEAAARQQADNNLQSQIDGISASSDVKDIVGTYAELQAYDTSTLGDNDIIKVLQDGTHSDETTYYRWSTATQTFTLIGEEGPYYTKSATDQLLNAKADRATTYTKTETDNLLSGKQNTLTAGSNISISGNTISATDTTYTAGNGISIQNGVISLSLTSAESEPF